LANRTLADLMASVCALSHAVGGKLIQVGWKML
jgi:hypothetical protein